MPASNWGIGTIGGSDGPELVATFDGHVERLTKLLPSRKDVPNDIAGLLPEWDSWCDEIDGAITSGDPGSWPGDDTVDFLAPVQRGGTLYLCGANFYDHIAEMDSIMPDFTPPDKETDDPYLFTMPMAATVGHRSPVERPKGSVKLDWEVELAVLIGKKADRVSAGDALDCIAGYTVANDVSVRDPFHFHPDFAVRWLVAKGYRTLKPIGPSIVPARFVPDPHALKLSLTVNGESRQDSSTNQMIWSVAEQIEYLSSLLPLYPGDVLLTGTPAGTAGGHQQAYLQDGDVMVASVEGIGVLENEVVPTAN